MALLNTSDNKFIAKPQNPDEQVKAEYIIVTFYTANKKQVVIEGQFCVKEQTKPQGPAEVDDNGNDIAFVPQDIWAPKGNIYFGTFEMDQESASFLRDCHNKAVEVLGSQFEIVDLKK